MPGLPASNSKPPGRKRAHSTWASTPPGGLRARLSLPLAWNGAALCWQPGRRRRLPWPWPLSKARPNTLSETMPCSYSICVPQSNAERIREGLGPTCRNCTTLQLLAAFTAIITLNDILSWIRVYHLAHQLPELKVPITTINNFTSCLMETGTLSQGYS